jgi:EAL domain-containing protein (putative c-di-GMP-specific phosphodiesterase class I)
VLSITESVIHQDPELILDRLRALKALGVRIAIAGFGHGHFSLTTLRQLPADILKISGPYVHDRDRRWTTWRWYQIMMTLAEMLRLDTLADGIETAAQFAALRDLGCPLRPGGRTWARR